MQLTSAQLNLPPPEQYPLQQKPPVYAQASDTLDGDRNLEMMLKIYNNLISKPSVGKRAIEMALSFYDDIIKDRKVPYVAEAYLKSGEILCCITEPKPLEEGKKRLEEAYRIGSIQVKVEASYWLGRLHYGHGQFGHNIFNLQDATKYLAEVIRLAPGSSFAEESKVMLLQINDIKKIKN
ncbi:hypothetical protein HYY71_01720 [Candidatus Woesearchaeota archaeon]|nr:hypothetical protein [Candidatus Woesearchaeota archaeon]